MAITLNVGNEMTMLADIERVRGNLTPADFIVKCIGDGVRLADLERRNKAGAAKPGMLNLGEVAPEFAKVDRTTVAAAVAEISERVKQVKESNPIYREVSRLMEKYKALLEARRKDTGGLPVRTIEGISLTPIQHFALEAALQSVQKGAGGTVSAATKH